MTTLTTVMAVATAVLPLLAVMTAVLLAQFSMIHRLKGTREMEDDTIQIRKVRGYLYQAFQLMEREDVYLPTNILVLLLNAALASGIDLEDITVETRSTDEGRNVVEIQRARDVGAS